MTKDLVLHINCKTQNETSDNEPEAFVSIYECENIRRGHVIDMKKISAQIYGNFLNEEKVIRLRDFLNSILSEHDALMRKNIQ